MVLHCPTLTLPSPELPSLCPSWLLQDAVMPFPAVLVTGTRASEQGLPGFVMSITSFQVHR